MVKATVLVTVAVSVYAAYFFSEIVDTYRTYSRGEFSMWNPLHFCGQVLAVIVSDYSPTWLSTEITANGQTLGESIIWGAGMAIFESVCLTYFLAIICCCDLNKKFSSIRKQWFLVLPTLRLVLVPGITMQNQARTRLDWFKGFDFCGDMLVLACGGHYHERVPCADRPMNTCAQFKGEMIVEWNTTNSTTGMPVTCQSRVWQPSCNDDICIYTNNLKNRFRCPDANSESARNQSMDKTSQCMLDRYQNDENTTTYFPACTDDMFLKYGAIYLPFYGNSTTCEVTIPPEHGEPEYFQSSYKVGVGMETAGYILLGVVFTGSLTEFIYRKERQAYVAAAPEATTWSFEEEEDSHHAPGDGPEVPDSSRIEMAAQIPPLVWNMLHQWCRMDLELSLHNKLLS